jgi:hypothetical protein
MWAQQASALHYIRLSSLARGKHSSLLGLFVKIQGPVKLAHGCLYTQGPYSQHFFFFATYKWAPQASVLHYIRLSRLARDKHSSLLGLFVKIQGPVKLAHGCLYTQGPCSQHFFFFASYKYAPQASVLHYIGLSRLARDKHSNVLGLFVKIQGPAKLAYGCLHVQEPYSQHFIFS